MKLKIHRWLLGVACYLVRFVPGKRHDRIHYWLWNWIDGGYRWPKWILGSVWQPEILWDDLAALFPLSTRNRPATCTRQRYKPFIDDCGCWWCCCLDKKIMDDIEREEIGETRKVTWVSH